MRSASLPINLSSGFSVNTEQLMASIQQNFARNLARMLKAKKITKRKLANAVDVVPMTVTHWTKGRSSPELFRLESIARVLGITVSALLQDVDDPPLKQRQVDALLAKIAKIDAMLEDLAEARGYELKRKRG